MSKAYDADAIITEAQAADIAVVVPSKRNRKVEHAMDSIKYRSRHLIENIFQRMKVFRRVATRFEKLNERFLDFVHIAGIMKSIQLLIPQRCLNFKKTIVILSY